MTPERWERVKELFDAALARTPPDRAAFVRVTCGEDSALCSEVERLLAEHERAPEFLEQPPAGLPWFDLSGSQTVTMDAHQIGQSISHYQILTKLGEGGMGIVYRAFDTLLLRPVAVKVLGDAAFADPESNRRFLREARAASALNHPNIAHIYEVGEAGGRPFIVMEYIEGRTLSEVIRERPLEFPRLMDFGVQAADAIAEAHEHGVIHRDIKPANIMVTARGPLKILDFGLAKVVSKQHGEDPGFTDTSLTAPGAVMGTIRYMSPEQLLGHNVDERTDIFSLGLVLYEMATGRQAFAAATAAGTMDRILHAEPEPIAAFCSSASPDLERIIRKCLEKDRERRYRTARELHTALHQLREAAHTASGWTADRRKFVLGAAAAGMTGIVTLLGIKHYGSILGPGWADSIAVLPFLNTNTDPEIEYLSDGITEGLINRLSQLPGLRVIARPTAFTFKGKPLDLGGVSRALKVRTVLTGKVTERGKSLNVQADLVSAKDGSELWGQQYAAGASEILEVQSQIVTQIVQKLRVAITSGQQARISAPRTANVEAYQQYLRGRYQWNQYTPEGWKKALDFFFAAIRIDPGYASAWAGVADSYYQMSSLVLPPREAIPKARAAAMKALELDETLAEAHASVGMIKAQYDWDGPGAEREFKRAIELNPSYATAHQWYGELLHEHARFDEALLEFNRAQELDPLTLAVGVAAAWPLHYRGQYDEAAKQIERMLDMYRNDARLLYYLHQIRAESFLERRLYQQAVEEFLESESAGGASPEAIAALKTSYETSGIRGYWQKSLDLEEDRYRKESEKARSAGTYVSSLALARLYARLGDRDRAFAALETCFQNRDENLLFLKVESIRGASPWLGIRSDSRFGSLLRRMGLEP